MKGQQSHLRATGRLMRRSRRGILQPCPDCGTAGWHTYTCQSRANYWSKVEGAHSGMSRYHFFNAQGALCRKDLAPHPTFKRFKQPYKACLGCIQRLTP